MEEAGTARADVPLEDWPLRPWILAALGAVAGLLIWFLLDNGKTDSPVRLALAAFAFFASLSAAFTVTLQRPLQAVLFSVLLGAVMGGVSFLVTDAGERLAGEEYAFGAGVFFSLLAVPLFQAGFHRTRFATPYRETHFHVWTDAVSAGGSIAFVLLSWLLLWLLHALFSLIGIDIIEELIGEGWFAGMFIGATFGAAMGVLRNQLGIIGTLQRVVMLVFALLAVPFAAALVIFLVILLGSGGKALWEATDAATPVLLSCTIGAFILCNSVVRDDDEARSGSIVMRIAAMALAACILPLTVFAAISMGIRIDQHGLSPERIWALFAIVIACTYGIAYCAGLLRGRMAAWSDYLRRANLHLAAITCVVALLLALPLVDFGAISVRDQLARLESGEVSAEDFDYTALKWDFGEAGREALDELAVGEGEAARLAAQAQAQAQEFRPSRYAIETPSDARLANLVVRSGDAELGIAFDGLVRSEGWRCTGKCFVVEIGDLASGAKHVALVEATSVSHFRWQNGALVPFQPEPVPFRAGANRTLADDTAIEVRDQTTRQIYIEGEAVGLPFSADPEADGSGDNGDQTENLLITVTTAEPAPE